ncbi:MAG: uracil-DNA glycosylase family protein [Balneolales bacterium]
MTFAEKILSFNASLQFDSTLLPDGISVMNPFRGRHAETILDVTFRFYKRFYSDIMPRHLILGINPGRFGAGVTGVPFTDTRRMRDICGIPIDIDPTYEPSSVFVYEVVDAFGGPGPFYQKFYINSVCPLGFTRQNEKGNTVNYNFYDDRQLEKAATPFIIDCIEKQIGFGAATDKCFCMGRGKNFKYLNALNKKQGWFDEIVPMDHPRFIVQYRSKRMEEYVQQYVEALSI